MYSINTMQKKISEILSWYPALTVKQRANMVKLFNHGRIGGTGKLVILPVDQGFEHGPARSFTSNPAGYNPVYHAELAIKSGCNAYAAPLGALEAAADIIAKNNLPTILKLNNHDLMMPDDANYFPAITAWIDDAVRLKASAVGMTVYAGSSHSYEMYQQARELVSDARKAGLIVVIWMYPRGSGLPSKEAEIAVDVISYGVHIACQLGAHIVKCKPSSNLVALENNVKRGVYKNLLIETLADRTKLVLKAAFDGRRVVICSGGEARTTDEIFEEIKQLKKGGAFGSIVGRNSFQRPLNEAVKLLHDIQDIYTS